MHHADGRRWLRKKDLVRQLAVAKSTLADWVTEFQVFIPTIQDGALTRYPPEALEVLTAIKAMRAEHLSKPEIYTRLHQQGFPVTVQEAVDDVHRAIATPNPRQGLLAIMNQVGTALEQLVIQKDGLNALTNRQNALIHQQNEQDGRMTDLERTVQALQAELAATKTERAVTKAEGQKQPRRRWPWQRSQEGDRLE